MPVRRVAWRASTAAAVLALAAPILVGGCESKPDTPPPALRDTGTLDAQSGALDPDAAAPRALGTSLSVTDMLPFEHSPAAPCEASGGELRFEAGADIDFEAPWPTGRVENVRDHHVGGGAAVVDVTGDDWPDLVLTAVHGSPALFVANGEGGFERRIAGFEDLKHTMSAYAVDLDADGLREVVFTAWDGVHVYGNLGGGLFERRAPLLIARPDERPTQLAWTDFDGDGFVDVYIGMGPLCFLDAEGAACGAHDRLLRGLGGGAFEDVSELIGTPAARSGLAMASAWLDVDRDGDVDILVGNDSGSRIVPNRVFINPGRASLTDFEERSEALGLDAGMAAMGIAFGHVDRDERRIIAVSNVRSISLFETGPEESAFTHTRLPPPFDDRDYGGLNHAAAWGVELEDLDHDGDLDLLAAWAWLLPTWWWEESRLQADLDEVARPLPPALWLREAGVFEDGSERLHDATPSWGLRTMIPVDLDRDGTLDIVMTSVMGPTSILMGRCPEGHWLSVSLSQAGGNTDALGGLVEVRSAIGTQRRRIGHGSTGAYSGREPVAHFGLASDTSAELHVTWPDGETTDLGLIPADRRLRVRRDRLPEP